MTTELTKRLWASGFVNRWHSHRDNRLRNAQDTDAAHSQRVAILVYRLWPLIDERWRIGTLADNIYASVVHDAPECANGDSPHTAKKDFELRAALGRMDGEWWKQIGDVPVMTPIVKLCDIIDAIMFCREVAPDLLEREDWQDDIAYTLGFAAQLGVRDEVEELVDG